MLGERSTKADQSVPRIGKHINSMMEPVKTGYTSEDLKLAPFWGSSQIVTGIST